jgi:hypothetical protein
MQVLVSELRNAGVNKPCQQTVQEEDDVFQYGKCVKNMLVFENIFKSNCKCKWWLPVQ